MKASEMSNVKCKSSILHFTELFFTRSIMYILSSMEITKEMNIKIVSVETENDAGFLDLPVKKDNLKKVFRQQSSANVCFRRNFP